MGKLGTSALACRRRECLVEHRRFRLADRTHGRSSVDAGSNPATGTMPALGGQQQTKEEREPMKWQIRAWFGGTLYPMLEPIDSEHVARNLCAVLRICVGLQAEVVPVPA